MHISSNLVDTRCSHYFYFLGLLPSDPHLNGVKDYSEPAYVRIKIFSQEESTIHVSYYGNLAICCQIGVKKSNLSPYDAERTGLA